MSYQISQANPPTASEHRLDEINKRIRIHSDFLSDLRMTLQSLADRLLGGHPGVNEKEPPRVTPVMCSVDTMFNSLDEQQKLIEVLRSLISRLQEL